MTKRKLAELTPDASNANKGTLRGRAALEASLRKYGAGRSILLDKHGKVIAGNKTFQVAGEIGLEDVLIVQTDGKQLVAVQRTDLDIDSPEGRGLAYSDNRVGELDLDWQVEQILLDVSAGVDLSSLWYDFEIAKLTGEGEVQDPLAEWQGMPEFENEDVLGAYATIKVHIANEADLIRFAHLMGQTVNKETKFIWYPKQERMNLQAVKVTDEP